MASKRRDWDYLPPEPLMVAIECQYLRAFGTNRDMAYDLTDGMALPSHKRHEVRDIVRNAGALDDLNDMLRFLEAVGQAVCNGGRWADILEDQLEKSRARRR